MCHMLLDYKVPNFLLLTLLVFPPKSEKCNHFPPKQMAMLDESFPAKELGKISGLEGKNDS